MTSRNESRPCRPLAKSQRPAADSVGNLASFGDLSFRASWEEFGREIPGNSDIPRRNLFSAKNRIPISFWDLSIRDEFSQPRTAMGSGSVSGG